MTDSEPTHLDDELDEVLIGGREPAVVQIADYDPAWPARFEQERRRIEAALGPLALGIQHIGSTAVPGLAAKPIIDVLVEVRDPDDEAAYAQRLESAGYVLRVRESRHRMFRTPARDVHVHVWAVGSGEVSEYLLLRDWLRANADDRMLYEDAKRALAGRHWRDMNDYAEAKSPVIEQIKARARRSAGIRISDLQ
jgi:GrpB-like predicted nucleotidyltransferase (UPF0157 family)